MASLIRRASEIEPRNTISILIYGQPGAGKSTLGMSAPDAVLLDFDNGVGRMHGAHRGLTVQVRSWEDTLQALAELENRPDIRSIVIDTAGKMLDYMSEYIMRTNTRMRKNDGTLSLQGYGLRKGMFVDFLRRVSVSGRNVIFIAHEREERRGDDTVKRPEIGGSSANDLIKELDLVGYVQMIGTQRTIAFCPTEMYYAKNSCGLPPVIEVPGLLDKDGNADKPNDFIAMLIERNRRSQERTREQSAKFDRLMDDVETAVANAGNGSQLNAILDSLDKREQVFNSRMAGRARVERRAKELGLTADATTGRYAD